MLCCFVCSSPRSNADGCEAVIWLPEALDLQVLAPCRRCAPYRVLKLRFTFKRGQLPMGIGKSSAL